MFVAIGDSEEPLDRMLEVLRFWFTKDLKYVKGKPCKPYNSVLGEFFRVCLYLSACIGLSANTICAVQLGCHRGGSTYTFHTT